MSALLFALAQQAPNGPPSTGGYLRGAYLAIFATFALYGLYLWNRHTTARGNKRGR